VINELVQYADSRPDMPAPFYRHRPIRWVLDLHVQPDCAATITINPHDGTDAVPVMRRSGSKPIPTLAVDQACYVLGVDGPGAAGVTPKQAETRFGAWWQQMQVWAAGPNSHPAVVAALVALNTATEVACEHEVGPRDRVATRVNGVWLHQLPQAHTEWSRIVSDTKSGPEGLCVSCGQHTKLARTLPNGIPGHLLPGADYDVQLTLLPEAEREAGGHLPICVECGDKATHALELLLADPRHSTTKSNTTRRTVVFGLGGADVDARVVALMQELGMPSDRPRGSDQ